MDLLYGVFINTAEISINMSIIILTAMLFRKISRNRISAASRYLIWIIIAARLILPFSANLDISVFRISESVIENESARIYSVEIMGQPYSMQTSTDSNSKMNESNTANPTKNPQNQTKSDKPIITVSKVMNILAIIWIIGVGVKLIHNITGYRFFIANIKRNRIAVNDKRIMVIFRHMCVKLNIKRVPELYLCDNITSPMLYGIAFSRKCIMIPADISNSAVITSIIRHELIHLKRGDLWVKLLFLAADSLHWFNPIIKLAGKSLELDMELSCDEKVLNGCDKKIRRAYGRIMIDIAQKCTYKPAIITTHFNPKFNDLKTRCLGILDTEEKNKGTFVVILFVILCLLSAMFLNYSHIITANDTVDDLFKNDISDIRNDINSTESNILISNKLNSVVDNSDNFDLENFVKFVGRFSNYIYGDISEIDINDPMIINYVINETYYRNGMKKLNFPQIKRTATDIFDIDLNLQYDLNYDDTLSEVPALFMNIVNINANEKGEVVVRIMYYDISASESGMSSDTYVGEGTYYFYFRDDDIYGQIYTFRFCFGERDYKYIHNSPPVLTQSQNKNLQVILSDDSVIDTPAYYKGDSMSLDIYNKIACSGDTIAVAGRQSKAPDEQFYVYTTHDKGATWKTTHIDCTTSTPYPVMNFIFNFVSESDGMLIICTSRPEIFVYTTSDGGLKWTKQHNFTLPEYENETLYAGGFITKEIGFICLIPVIDSTENPNVFITRDGGFSWDKMTIKPPADSQYNETWTAFAGTPEYNLNTGQIKIPVIVHVNKTIYYMSDDLGVTWYWA